MARPDEVNPSTGAPIAGPPPPRYHNSSWSLISQGAEARLWRIPHYYTISGVGGGGSSGSGSGSASTAATAATITATTGRAAACKERFPKSYRHPTLDAALTKARTRGEARCLVRCRRGGVPCPAVLGVDDAGIRQASSRGGADADEVVATEANNSGGGAPPPPPPSSSSSSCLFLEWIDGCTVREYLEKRAHYPEDEADFAVERDSDDVPAAEAAEGGGGDNGGEPARKKVRTEAVASTDSTISDRSRPAVKVTRVDDDALSIVRAVGVLVADMHNVNIVHGDLTTSNVMVRNPPPLDGDGNGGKIGPVDAAAQDGAKSETKAANDAKEKWVPSLVLIDFGLSGTAGSKGVSHEEKAVDLYVLERAFEATHPGSRELVAEFHRAYKGRCKTADSVLQRLSQVRLRGRKRECFG